jgi:hypothetical protein
MSLSVSCRFLFGSVCPNQYTIGSRADEDKAVGVDVAVAPNGFAGVQVGIAADKGQADTVPGIVQPP